jgi:hypothetical protein
VITSTLLALLVILTIYEILDDARACTLTRVPRLTRARLELER